MEIIIAKQAGFCFGVKNAIDAVYRAIDNERDKIYTLGPIIHNNTVINELSQKGVNIIENIDDIKDKQGVKVIIRSHGVGLDTYRQAAQAQVEIIDSTCPFVKKIHEKVQKYYNEKYDIIIIGDPNHPEVIGINGWCNNQGIIINNKEEALAVGTINKGCIVAQTTITRDKWDTITGILKDKIKEKIEFNTICNATSERQNAAIELAKQADAMIIVGGLHSSNTKKLAQVSKTYCPNTFHIETSDDLDMKTMGKYKRVGIAAGASTPDNIIKEVVLKLAENNKSMENEQFNMMEEIDKSFTVLHQGDVVVGQVISIGKDEIVVNVGYKSDGIIERSEITDEEVDLKEIYRIGDEIEVMVLKVNDGEGNVVLSKKRIEIEKNWDKLEQAKAQNKIVEAKITSAVKGGVTAKVFGIRGFIPASLLDVRFVSNLEEYVGKEVRTEITELNRSKNKIVLSSKAVIKKEMEEKSAKVWETIEPGQVLSGTIRRLTDFGAFVDLGGVDGLIHISDLSWNRVKHPSQVVSEGQIVQVQVLDANKEKGRISLGLKQTVENPWEKFTKNYKTGDVVDAKVTNITNFGAFAEIIPGVEGLIHISHLSDKYIAKVEQAVKSGEIVKVKIIEIDEAQKKVSISKKDVEEITE